MAQGKRDRLSTEQRIDMWRRWKSGESLHEIGRAFGKGHGSIRFLLGDLRIRDYLALRRCALHWQAPCARNPLVKMLKSAPNLSAFQPEGFWHRNSHDSSNRTPICIRSESCSQAMGKVRRKSEYLHPCSWVYLSARPRSVIRKA